MLTSRKSGCNYIKLNFQIYNFYVFFYYSSIVTASFNKITVFHRDGIIENDRIYILYGHKYIASINSNVLTKFNHDKNL